MEVPKLMQRSNTEGGRSLFNRSICSVVSIERGLKKNLKFSCLARVIALLQFQAIHGSKDVSDSKA